MSSKGSIACKMWDCVLYVPFPRMYFLTKNNNINNDNNNIIKITKTINKIKDKIKQTKINIKEKLKDKNKLRIKKDNTIEEKIIIK